MGESLQNCPYLAVWSLDPLVQMVSSHVLLDAVVHDRSLSRGLPFTCPPPEQYFNPTTYNFGRCKYAYLKRILGDSRWAAIKTNIELSSWSVSCSDVAILFCLCGAPGRSEILIVVFIFLSCNRCYLPAQLWNCALNLLWLSERGKFVC